MKSGDIFTLREDYWSSQPQGSLPGPMHATVKLVDLQNLTYQQKNFGWSWSFLFTNNGTEWLTPQYPYSNLSPDVISREYVLQEN